MEALAAEAESDRGGPYPRLTLDFGVRFSRLAVEWLSGVERVARARVKAGPAAPPAGGASARPAGRRAAAAGGQRGVTKRGR